MQALGLAQKLDLAWLVADVTTTLAGIDQRSGDPETAERALAEIVEQAHRDGDAHAEMRGRYLLAGLYHERGELARAQEAYREGFVVANAVGRPWAPYGFEARLMEALVAYERGAWDDSLQLTLVAGTAPPPIPEAMLLGVRALVSVGRGYDSSALVLEQLRPLWGLDGLVGITAAAAEIDWHGRRHDIHAVMASFERALEIVGAFWSEYFQARIRLTALVLGHLADAAGRGAHNDRADLVARTPELMTGVDRVMQRVQRRKRPFGPEGVAWLERAYAEHLRLRWLADVEPPEEEELLAAWERTIVAFQEMGQPYETARSQARMASVLRAAGRTAEARELVVAVRAAAEQLGADPLLADLRQAGEPGGPRPAGRHSSDRSGDRDPPAGRPGPQQRGGRPAAVHQRQDGQRARVQHPREARCQWTHRGGGHRPPRRPAPRLDGCFGPLLPRGAADWLTRLPLVSWRARLVALRVDTTPLRESRDFRLLFVAGTVFYLGGMVSYVAIPFQLYRLTGSNFAVGALGLVELVPLVLFGLYGGALADHVDRRRVLVLTGLAQVVLTAVLLVNAFLAEPQLWVIYGASALLAAAQSLQRPSKEALEPRTVRHDQITAASALSTLGVQVGLLSGPAIGGLLVVSVGVGWCFVVDVCGLLTATVLYLLMRPYPHIGETTPPSLKGIGEGVAYALRRRDLLGTYLVDIAAMLMAMPVVVFPALAEDVFAHPELLGLLYTAETVGSMAATATSGWASRVHHHGRAIVLAASAYGALIALAGIAPSIGVAIGLFAAAGAADMVSGIFRATIWNQTIPDAMRGRLAGIEMLSYSLGPLGGQVRAGLVADAWSVRGSIASGGLLCVVGVSATALWLRDFWSYDSRTDEHAVRERAARAAFRPPA